MKNEKTKNNSEKIHIDNLIYRIMFASIAMVIALFIIDAIINYRGSAPGRTISIIFDMALEESLAGWFSSIIILFAGITLFFIYLYKRKI